MTPVLELPIDDREMLQIARIVTEMRAEELRHALRDAVAGASHWRIHARQLLREIDNGVLP
jgi:hypothetical protein